MKDIISELKKIKKATPSKLLDFEVLEQLRNSEIPILLWGCGNYAEYIYHILKRNKIKIDNVFIDYENKGLKFHEYNILSFEDVKNKYDKINIVRGNGNIEREAYYKEISIVDSVYSFFDLMGFGWHLNEESLDSYSETINDMYNEFVDDASNRKFYSLYTIKIF